MNDLENEAAVLPPPADDTPQAIATGEPCDSFDTCDQPASWSVWRSRKCYFHARRTGWFRARGTAQLRLTP